MTERLTPAPLEPTRQALVLDRLDSDGAVRISDLTEALGVSPVTLRRDLARMERKGLLKRVHGGAVAVSGAPRTGVALDDAPASAPAPDDDPDGAIAVLLPSLNYYWPGVVRGIEAEARRHGLRTVIRATSYDLQDERPMLERLLADETISGLVVAPNTDTDHAQDVVQWLVDAEIPSVLVERDAVALPAHTPLESVTTDHALGASLAARHLAELGHRHVGLVLSRRSPTSRKIATGWQSTIAELGLTASGAAVATLPDRGAADFSAVVNATLDEALGSGITGLLVHSDPEAMAIIDLAMLRGISVPEQLSVVAYDDEVAEHFSPALTAVSPPRHAVGEAAVDLLVKRHRAPGRPTRRVTLSPLLNVRESTAPAPGGLG